MKIKCCLVWTHKAFLSCLQGDGSRGQELNAEEINPLNTKLNLICHLLALLGAHHILHISRKRVNNSIYIYIYKIPLIRISPNRM